MEQRPSFDNRPEHPPFMMIPEQGSFIEEQFEGPRGPGPKGPKRNLKKKCGKGKKGKGKKDEVKKAEDVAPHDGRKDGSKERHHGP